MIKQFSVKGYTGLDAARGEVQQEMARAPGSDCLVAALVLGSVRRVERPLQ